MIDRPDVVRRVENFKRLTLTDFKIDIHKLAKKKDLKKALEENGKICSRLAAADAKQRRPCSLSSLASTRPRIRCCKAVQLSAVQLSGSSAL